MKSDLEELYDLEATLPSGMVAKRRTTINRKKLLKSVEDKMRTKKR